MKAKTKLVTLLALFILLACTKQEILQLEEETQIIEPKINVESFQIKELPDLAIEINNLAKSAKMDWTSKSTGDGIVLDESRISAVTDSVGNTTFSIRMNVPDTPYNVFHNMVIKRTPDGKINEPFVLRYEVGKNYWPTYFSSERKEAPFSGNVEVYSINSISKLGSKTNKNGTGDQPCYTYSSTTGSSGSGSGSSGSGVGNGNSNGDPGTQGGFSSTGIFWGSGSTTKGGYVEVGKGIFGRPAPDGGDTEKSYSAKNGECSEDELLIPINIKDEKPPSCKSFNYVKTGSNWQQSNIKSIYFHVWITRSVPPYAEYKYTVRIKEAINFGAPLLDRFNNKLDPGVLASASANALNQAMKATVHKFDAAAVNNPSDIDNFFKETIRDDFPLHIIGGRATPNTTSSLPATRYEATTDPNFGGCHKK